MKMFKKTTDDELKPPTFSAHMRDMNGDKGLEIIFNKSKDCFDYDVILIKRENHDCECKQCKKGIYIVRDDLASVIQEGFKRTEQYVENELLK